MRLSAQPGASAVSGNTHVGTRSAAGNGRIADGSLLTLRRPDPVPVTEPDPVPVTEREREPEPGSSVLPSGAHVGVRRHGDEAAP